MHVVITRIHVIIFYEQYYKITTFFHFFKIPIFVVLLLRTRQLFFVLIVNNGRIVKNSRNIKRMSFKVIKYLMQTTNGLHKASTVLTILYGSIQYTMVMTRPSNRY